VVYVPSFRVIYLLTRYRSSYTSYLIVIQFRQGFSGASYIRSTRHLMLVLENYGLIIITRGTMSFVPKHVVCDRFEGCFYQRLYCVSSAFGKADLKILNIHATGACGTAG